MKRGILVGLIVISFIGLSWAMDVKLSEHFTQREFTCKCGCGQTKVNMELVIKLEELRKQLGLPIIITSGYRCPKHNKEVGGVEDSQHLYGNAADIKVKRVTPEMVGIFAEDVGFSYVKVYRSWVHVDVRR